MKAGGTPKRFILCVDRFDRGAGQVWAVRTGGKWLTARVVYVMVLVMQTVFRGTNARQPKAYLEGYGVVRRHRGGVLTITTGNDSIGIIPSEAQLILRAQQRKRG